MVCVRITCAPATGTTACTGSVLFSLCGCFLVRKTHLLRARGPQFSCRKCAETALGGGWARAKNQARGSILMKFRKKS